MKKILSLLTKDLKIAAISLIGMMSLASFMELFNLSVLIIIINFFLNSETQNTSFIFLGFLSDLFNRKEISLNYILYLFFLIYLIKISVLIYTNFKEAKFIANFKEIISNSLFTDFLNREPHNILKRNSSIYLRNFTTEIDITGAYYKSLIQIILDFIIVLALLPFLFFFDFVSAVAATSVLTSFSLLYYFVIKNFISLWARKRSLSQKKKVKFVNEGFSAIKYIKMLSRENYFIRKFKEQTSILSKVHYKVTFMAGLPRNLLELFLFSSIILTLIILFQFSYNNDEIIKIISVYVVASLRMVPSLNRILGNFQNLKYTYMKFEKLKKLVQKLKIKTAEEYRRAIDKKLIPSNVPRHPDNKRYAPTWKGWRDFLGTG